jgi:hypothetical protein
MLMETTHETNITLAASAKLIGGIPGNMFRMKYAAIPAHRIAAASIAIVTEM